MTYIPLSSIVARLDRNADLIESQRGAHTWQGDWYYVDPVNGDTIANGNDGTRALPLDTVTEALSLVTDSNHDTIFLLAGAAAGPTTLTEHIVIDKRYCFLRGPGRDMIIVGPTNSSPTIEVTADGVEISGCQINTQATGTPIGIQVTSADFVKINGVWINDTRGDGVRISSGDRAQIANCRFLDTGQSGAGDGLSLTGSCSECEIENNQLSNVQGDGITIKTGPGSDDNVILRNVIHDCTGNGINIDNVGSQNVVADNRIGNSGGSDISDSGTNTVLINNEQYGLT